MIFSVGAGCIGPQGHQSIDVIRQLYSSQALSVTHATHEDPPPLSPPLPLPSPATSVESQIAVTQFLDRVRERFSGCPSTYNSFLQVMKDFNSQIIPTRVAAQRVHLLFRGHDDIIAAFDQFLPPINRLHSHDSSSPNFMPPTPSPISSPPSPPPISANFSASTVIDRSDHHSSPFQHAPIVTKQPQQPNVPQLDPLIPDQAATFSQAPAVAQPSPLTLQGFKCCCGKIFSPAVASTGPPRDAVDPPSLRLRLEAELQCALDESRCDIVTLLL